MVKPKVLCICNQGITRSKYLNDYLNKLGHETRYKGIHKDSSNKVKQIDVNWADIIVFARPKFKEIFLNDFKAKDKKIITLNVWDRETKEEKEKYVYPKLKDQIDKYLPLKK